jgi:hypothetical protein
MAANDIRHVEPRAPGVGRACRHARSSASVALLWFGLRQQLQWAGDLGEYLGRDVRVDRRGPDAPVAQEILDHPQVRAVLQQVRCERMAKRVGGDLF